MSHAIEETNRRREKQVAYHTQSGVDRRVPEAPAPDELVGGPGRQQSRAKSPVPGLSSRARAAARAAGAGVGEDLTGEGGGPARDDLVELIKQLTEQMHAAAAELQFEVAARLRDEIRELKHELRGMQAAGV